MNTLAIFTRRDIVPEWKWRDGMGDFHAPSAMETRHLFYTLRMIWNHSMPEFMRVGHNIRRYRFSAFYDGAYMREAVYHIGRECLLRPDLLAWQKAELEEMAAWMRHAAFDEIFNLPQPQKRIAQCA